jgi:hypothetical protein
MADGAWMALDERGFTPMGSPVFHAAGMSRLMPDGDVVPLDIAGDDESVGRSA